MRGTVLVFVVVLNSLFSTSIYAATTYVFSGVITESSDVGSGSSDSDNFNRLFDGIAVGSVFTGEFTYDGRPSSAFDGYVDATSIFYTFSSLTFTVGTNIYSSGRDINSLTGRRNDSELTFLDYSDYSTSGFGDQIGILFGDRLAGGVNINGESYPAELSPNLLAGDIMISSGIYYEASEYSRDATLTGMVTQISEIPLPTSFWLFASGILALLGGLNKRTK